MADASRFPEGVVVNGSLAVARPVNTIVENGGALFISTNAAVATYTALTGSTAAAPAFGAWTALVLINSWIDDGTGFGFYSPQFRTDGEVVQLRGFIRAPASLAGANARAFQLPVAARPAEFVNFIIGVTTNPASTQTFSNIQVSAVDDANPGFFETLDTTLTTDWFLLDGLSFSLLA